MTKHVQLAERTGIAVYFCDPHSTQEQLDEIAGSLNTRPRKSLGFRTPVTVYNEFLLNMELAKSATKH